LSLLRDATRTSPSPLSLHAALPIYRGSIPGIVHGASASGASLFLEPLGTVDINNELVELEEREAEEVRRILLELTDAFRARPDRSEEHTSELQSRENLVCPLLLEKQ